MKALFADPEINKTHRLGAVNSINWARILAQITYYFSSYFQLIKHPSFVSGSSVRFVVPTGNFGDILAGYFAKRMGLPSEKLVIATNENDILHRFWKSGHYEKKPVHSKEEQNGYAEDGAKAHPDGVRETLSPAMDILVSSNFERLLWYLSYRVYGQGAVEDRRRTAGEKVKTWLSQLKTEDGFSVDKDVLAAAQSDFESERVADEETIHCIQDVYNWQSAADKSEKNPPTVGTRSSTGGYILDPHSAVGITASLRSIERSPPPTTHHISLSTAHPAKFSKAVEQALQGQKGFTFQTVLPEQFIGLEDKPRRVTTVEKSRGMEGVRSIVMAEVEAELAAAEKGQ